MIQRLRTHWLFVCLFLGHLWHRDQDGDRCPWRTAWSVARLAYYRLRIYRF